MVCKQNFIWFRVPDPLEALQFSFEVMPEKMLIMNNGRLPMGVHAWNKYNPEFWKPYLASLGYQDEKLILG